MLSTSIHHKGRTGDTKNCGLLLLERLKARPALLRGQRSFYKLLDVRAYLAAVAMLTRKLFTHSCALQECLVFPLCPFNITTPLGLEVLFILDAEFYLI